jgi:hypothetical protein
MYLFILSFFHSHFTVNLMKLLPCKKAYYEKKARFFPKFFFEKFCFLWSCYEARNGTITCPKSKPERSRNFSEVGTGNEKNTVVTVPQHCMKDRLFYKGYFSDYIHSFNHILTIHLSVAIRRSLSPFPHRT